ncbi:fumarylacetoacetate hydrolase family protein [Spirillospora sp. NPDC047279]|uniref:fumarylacetoacetate hydrolase family protein n=1 Tax=Spirillospora sp. NPDC047279 TaxID=3155478 RepID=UPI0033C4D7DF
MASPQQFVLGTFADPAGGGAYPGLVSDDHVLDLRTAGPPLPGPPAGGLTTRVLLEHWDAVFPLLGALAGRAAAEGVPVADLRVLAPVEPRQVFQSGANYRTHVIDLAVAHRAADDPRDADRVRAETAAMMDRRAAEDLPYVFVGLPSAITGPYDDVVLPSWCAEPDWELELAAVIGRPACRVDRDAALAHVAAYTIANDVTAREVVFRPDMPAIGSDWLRAKNAPTFTPLGPWLVPAAFVADPRDLRLTLKVNGEVRQDESAKDMIFDVARLVSYVSQTTTLLPGDLVLTGSPAGNGKHWGQILRDGDVMEGSITGLGTQRNRCRAES